MNVNVMIAQVNPCIGDLVGNLSIMQSEIDFAVQQDVDIIVFPELVTTGYPPRDLLYRNEIWSNHDYLLARLKTYIGNLNKNITVIFGGLHYDHKFNKFNAAYVMDKNFHQVVCKTLLPCYDVFDETRYFKSGSHSSLVHLHIKEKELICNVLICEDIWNWRCRCESPLIPGRYSKDPVSHVSGHGPLFVLNGSPFWKHKVVTCLDLGYSICQDKNKTIIYANQVGAHDDIITHGGSFVMSKSEQKVTCSMGNLFATDRIIAKFEIDEFGNWKLISSSAKSFTTDEDIPMINARKFVNNINPIWYGKPVEQQDFDVWCDFQAMRLHLIDYCRRTGFKDVLLGLSGGIDSALVAAIAAEALGGKHVHGVTMPSKYSSEGSWKNSEQLANNLNLGSFYNISIKDVHQSIRGSLLSAAKPEFDRSVTDENLQARIRANILMSLSNDNNWLLLTTGNKSEISVGYFTIFGDSVGFIAPIHDLWKTEVFEMCKLINKYAGREMIPVDIIEKPPSAELKDNQKDTDSLPSYDLLDPILIEIVEKESSLQEMCRNPNNQVDVRKIVKLYTQSEFKRAQLCLGPKLKERSFGSGRRMPIACKVTVF